MKIRTDFVTNSSSSSFCMVVVELEDREIKYDIDEWELIAAPNLNVQELNNVSNVEDLIHAIDGMLYDRIDYENGGNNDEIRFLTYAINEFESKDAEKFIAELKSIEDITKLTKIIIDQSVVNWGEDRVDEITETGRKIQIGYNEYDKYEYDFVKKEASEKHWKEVDDVLVENEEGHYENLYEYEKDEDIMKVIEKNNEYT